MAAGVGEGGAATEGRGLASGGAGRSVSRPVTGGGRKEGSTSAGALCAGRFPGSVSSSLERAAGGGAVLGAETGGGGEEVRGAAAGAAGRGAGAAGAFAGPGVAARPPGVAETRSTV